MLYRDPTIQSVSCGLSEEQIDVLFWFYSKHLLSPKASLHEEAVYSRLRARVSNPEDVVSELRNQFYIGKHKKMCLYADAGRVIMVLKSHRAAFLPAHLRPKTLGA